MGGPRNTLTPMIGLSLAALVAGSLITLAVLAQRVTLQGSVTSPILPRPPRTENTAPLVVGDQGAEVIAPEQERRAGREPVDRVLPLRVAKAPAEPKPSPLGRPKEQKAPREKPKGHGKGLPPGLARKGPHHASFHGGGRARIAPAAGKPKPGGSDHAKPQGGCGSPPCGRALGHKIGKGHAKQKGVGHHGGHHRHKD